MNTKTNGKRRVVITGMGALTPLGDVDNLWDGLLNGKSGIRNITRFDPEDLGVRIAGEVDFESKEHFPPKEARRMSRASQLALIAARMALQDTGLTREEVKQKGDRVGVVIGTGNAGFELLVDMSYAYTYKGRKPLPTVFVNGLPNLPGHHISVEMGSYGPLMTITTACASGTQGIGTGTELIRSGKSDMVFAGGVDCMIRKEVVVAFNSMTALTREFSQEPQRASRPFDAERAGFVLGEGAGILVLESLESAESKGRAHICGSAGTGGLLGCTPYRRPRP